MKTILVDAYRRRLIFEGEIKQTLDYGTRMQVHKLSCQHDVPLNYDIEEYRRHLPTLSKEAIPATHAA